MAGIGFELRHLLRKNTLTSIVQAYTYAGVIGSGPWVFSIIGILMVGVFSVSVVVPTWLVTQFQTSVTYLVACSLILTGPVQLAFTRFVSDRLFLKQDESVLPNLHGLLLIVMGTASALGTLALFVALPGQSLVYRMLMLAGFALMCGVWVLTVLLSGLKHYRAVAALFALTYVLIVVLSLPLRYWGLEGLLASFVLGHVLLLAGMWVLVLRSFPLQKRWIAFDFKQRSMVFPALIAVGLLYNLAIWADKFMFWFFPPTSQQIIGGLRASLIYDLPVFLSYLSIIPGMAVFLVRIETDFVEYYDKFFDAVRGGGSLDYIQSMRNEMVYAIQAGLGEIAKIQTLAVLVTFVAGPGVLRLLDISQLYLPLLQVQVVGAGLQVGVMAVLNVFFYLDQRRTVLMLCALMLGLNIVFTAITLMLGAAFYGYGFCLSMLITLCVGLHKLSRELDRLEYKTFMLQ
ncbi:exopolysaccharide Pel transporter PelG [Comamonas composti]|uniref:exopolysaccharide Pel transporter PelG n=1 Tax=Comamonas composti TaxID=408558 RepID=UPI0004234ED9|nr:exopolysaccharide Pel transporter PelG [Comamonas composti]